VNAKALHFVSGHDRNFRQLLGRRVVLKHYCHSLKKQNQ
jgi:hypothetical protein